MPAKNHWLGIWTNDSFIRWCQLPVAPPSSRWPVQVGLIPQRDCVRNITYTPTGYISQPFVTDFPMESKEGNSGFWWLILGRALWWSLAGVVPKVCNMFPCQVLYLHTHRRSKSHFLFMLHVTPCVLIQWSNITGRFLRLLASHVTSPMPKTIPFTNHAWGSTLRHPSHGGRPKRNTNWGWFISKVMWAYLWSKPLPTPK